MQDGWMDGWMDEWINGVWMIGKTFSILLMSYG
jgi:hypothetical protein